MSRHECMPAQQISPSAAKSLAVILGHFGGSAKGFGDFLRVAFGIGGPVRGTIGRVDADDAVLPDAVLVQHFGNAAGLFDGQHEFFSCCGVAHR